MRSLDSENSAPENVLDTFERSLTQRLENLKEKKEHVSQQDLKTFIRFFCKKNAAMLGLDEKKSQQVAQYFFKLTYENPEEISKIWELLHKLSENSTNQEAANQIFAELIETNKEGLTFLWRVIRGIVRGNFAVEAIEIDGKSIYHLATPKDTAERRKDENRRNVSDSLKAQIENDITHKPLPDTGIDSVRMERQDRTLFFKILQYMQSDTDALLASNAWREVISEYFNGITSHLLSTIKILEVQGVRSDARKKRYRNFIMHVLQGYQKSLIEYCQVMVTNQNERNPFAADLLFEHYLLSSNLLIDGVKEPSHAIIEEKWGKLFEEMKTYIEDNATMYGMQAFDTPEVYTTTKDPSAVDHFAPQVTDEIPPPPQESIEQIRENTRDTVDPVGKTIMMGGSVPIPEPQKDDWDKMLKPKEPEAPDAETTSLGKTAIVAAIMEEEIGKFSKKPQALPSTRAQRVTASPMFSYQCVTVMPGTEAETKLIKVVIKDIDTIFSEQAVEIKSQVPSEDFVGKLAQIAKNQISTYALMTEFVSRILIHYEDLSRKLNPHEANNVFDNISATFNTIGEGLSIPSEIVQSLVKRRGATLNDAPIPMSPALDEIIKNIPSIDSKDFENLKAFLLRKGLHSRFQEIENELGNKMVKADMKGLGALAEINRRLEFAASSEEGFIYYYKEKEALVEAALKDIKKLAGNWFTKHFKTGRSKQVKEEMRDYLNQLGASVNATWDQALEPTLNQYGRVIFGLDLYAQKT